ncbi:zinc-binding dehydrogenase [Streptomyces sp. NPDC058293]|uniref:zinc-binding dehydrogenase n=1 Tax=unclassified Streptomyces TaxID=2593676 RepID=UPI0033AE9F69
MAQERTSRRPARTWLVSSAWSAARPNCRTSPTKAVLAADLSEEAIGGKVDVLIDTVGGTILRDALGLVRPCGRAALVGYTAGRELTLDLADFFLADVSLLPVNMISRGKEVAAEVVRLLPDLSSGELTLPASVTASTSSKTRWRGCARARRSARWCSTWADPAGRRGGRRCGVAGAWPELWTLEASEAAGPRGPMEARTALAQSGMAAEADRSTAHPHRPHPLADQARYRISSIVQPAGVR